MEEPGVVRVDKEVLPRLPEVPKDQEALQTDSGQVFRSSGVPGRCLRDLSSDGGARGLFVDHDHSCCPRNGSESATCGQCIRALLCSSCNTGLGQFQDDPELLQKAINYLKSN